MSQPRFVVVYASNARDLQEKVNGYDYYDVVQMTSGPWFEKSGPDNTLEQTGDSIYVLMELREAPAKPDLPGHCGRRIKQ
ncbi:hypothetical protein LCGC14_2219220 [marine sediment metagenome]|uniref:Uncharacterized protein n=1 Tax=marine sediment metagenome TaxID=412755 RepID=A0A0F9AW22_9ZZZZ